MTGIDVDCRPTAEGWTCSVRLGEPDAPSSCHEVTVSRVDLERLASGATDPTELVRRSFAFLLAHEPEERSSPASIPR